MQPFNFNLNISMIKISMVQNASAVNIGKNLLFDWDSHSKTNQGLGNISGDKNRLEHLVNHVEDPDKIDLFSQQEQASHPNEDMHKLVASFFGDDGEKDDNANQG